MHLTCNGSAAQHITRGSRPSFGPSGFDSSTGFDSELAWAGSPNRGFPSLDPCEALASPVDCRAIPRTAAHRAHGRRRCGVGALSVRCPNRTTKCHILPEAPMNWPRGLPFSARALPSCWQYEAGFHNSIATTAARLEQMIARATRQHDVPFGRNPLFKTPFQRRRRRCKARDFGPPFLCWRTTNSREKPGSRPDSSVYNLFC
ncbi:uncharacterized protein B0H64DRAFT_87506 [Chaetomium fimeti]|uniref:Uncharacterized protein n=1 Tax=Chaetomium fimeti TaxID=1854472 RepID=A0AAE0HM13_9PEZI|nr:hypothetical protein B0H64DRAFT_87506 [Chaetomium fimeti]